MANVSQASRPPGKKILGLPAPVVIVGGITVLAAVAYFWIRSRSSAGSSSSTDSSSSTEPIDPVTNQPYAQEVSDLETQLADLQSSPGSTGGGSGGGGDSGGGDNDAQLEAEVDKLQQQEQREGRPRRTPPRRPRRNRRVPPGRGGPSMHPGDQMPRAIPASVRQAHFSRIPEG